jgi:hypothetical protein
MGLQLIKNENRYDARDLMLIKLNGDHFFILACDYKDWTCMLNTGDYHVHEASPYRINSKLEASMEYLPVYLPMYEDEEYNLKQYVQEFIGDLSSKKLGLKLIKGGK